MQDVMGSRLSGVTIFSVRSVGSYACQSMVVEGGTTLCIQWPMGLACLTWGIGSEVTCDVLSMRIPGSQEKGEECSVAP